MRIVLERNDLIKIIGQYLEATLDPSRVVVRTDPFEVEVTDVPLTESSPETRLTAPSSVFVVTSPDPVKEPDISIVQARSEINASIEMPPFDEVEGGTSTENANPAGILAISQTLQTNLDRENPQLVSQRKRLLNAHGQPLGSEDMPPFNESEV